MGNIEKEEVSTGPTEPVSGDLKYSSTSDAMNFRVIPSNEYAMKGILNKLQVLFQIQTRMPEAMKNKERPPLSIAVVLDRSGSMSGDKIDQCKEAIKQMVYQLTDKDKIHFIVYDSEVDLIFENGDLSNKKHLENQVMSIKTKGCTNMGDALELATEVLLRNKTPDIDLYRIFLFSDGLVNEGKYRTHDQLFKLAENILKKGISVTSFGIGDNFDETLMKGIADRSESNYFYIEDASFIEKYISTVFRDTLGCIGTEAKLMIRGLNGSVLSKIYSEGAEALLKGVQIGDIKPNNTKSILAEFDYTPNASLEEEEIVSYALSFKHKESKETMTIEGKLKIKITDNTDLVATKNPETEVALSIQQAADIDEKVLKLIEQNKIKEALEENEKQIELLKAQEMKDTTGRVQNLWKKVERQQTEMKKKSTSKKKMAKMAHYHGHLKRRDSSDYMGM